MTDTVAVIAQRIGHDIGVRARPRLAAGIVWRVEFIEFDIGGYPESQLLAARPDDLRAIAIRPIIIEIGIAMHG
jgi:hypothetical protein